MGISRERERDTLFTSWFMLQFWWNEQLFIWKFFKTLGPKNQHSNQNISCPNFIFIIWDLHMPDLCLSWWWSAGESHCVACTHLSFWWNTETRPPPSLLECLWNCWVDDKHRDCWWRFYSFQYGWCAYKNSSSESVSSAQCSAVKHREIGIIKISDFWVFSAVQFREVERKGKCSEWPVMLLCTKRYTESWSQGHKQLHMMRP